MLYSPLLWLQDLRPRIRGKWMNYLLSCQRLSFGPRLRCEKDVVFTVRSGGRLKIGNNVEIRRDVEFRVTGEAVVEIGNNVRIDRGVRIIATNNAHVKICDNVRLGLHTVLNAGDSITIGEKTLISGFVYLQTSMHRHQIGQDVQDQGYDHAPIVIGNDTWIGAHATLLPGVALGEGAIVGSTAVVTKNVGAGEIVAGVPAKRLKDRAQTN